MRLRHVARVMYDGRSFRGWQIQDKYRTVQGVLSNVISKRFDQPNSFIIGASRTDSGVHARGQAFHFETQNPVDDYDKLQFQLNSLLPPDIRVFDLRTAPTWMYEGRVSQFHACKSALGKHYRYKFTTNAIVEPTLVHYCTGFRKPVDLVLFNDSLQSFVGTHDFSAFGNRVDKLKQEFIEHDMAFETRRTINSIQLNDDGNRFFSIDFQIQSAMYKMIRNIVGTCYSVASGDMPLEELRRLLHEGRGRKDNRARAAEPQGLCLEKVYYGEHY